MTLSLEVQINEIETNKIAIYSSVGVNMSLTQFRRAIKVKDGNTTQFLRKWFCDFICIVLYNPEVYKKSTEVVTS